MTQAVRFCPPGPYGDPAIENRIRVLARELAQRQSAVFHGEEYREAEVTALQAVCCGFEFRLLHARFQGYL